MKKISIDHETLYNYAGSAKHSIQLMRVTPQSLGHQKVLSWCLSLPRLANEIYDGFGNYCTVLSLHEPHETLRIRAAGEVEIDDSLDYVDDERLPAQIFVRETPLTRCTGHIRALAQRHLNGRIDREALIGFATDILARMPYTPNVTEVSTTAADAFLLGKGVCQDHTHVFLAGVRKLGIPARYVSGYLHTEASGHLASHAWAEAYLEGHWYVFDISNQIFTPSDHVQLAIGLDYNDAAPVRGVRVGGGREHMEYRVAVRSDQ